MRSRRKPHAKIIVGVLLVLSSLTVSCASESEDNAASITGKRISVEFTAGPAYEKTHWFGIFPATLQPQIAVWIENQDGLFIDTIFVTDKAAKGTWQAAPQEGRPESLPVWYHASAGRLSTTVSATTGASENSSSQKPDAISGATPGTYALKAWKLPDAFPKGNYVIKLEVNSSYDYNDTWPDGLKENDPRYSGVNGQPSLVYFGTLLVGDTGIEITLEPIGTGSVLGTDGVINPGLQGLTTVLQILQSVKVSYLNS